MAEKDFVVGQNIIADNIDSNGVISSGFTTTSITTNSATTIATFDKTTAESAQFIVSAVQGPFYGTLFSRCATKVLVAQNQTTASATESGEVNTMMTSTMVSNGGVIWTSLATSGDSFYFGNYIYTVAYGNGTWVVGGVQGRLLSTADNGAWSWTSRASNFSYGIHSVAYGNNLWVAGGAYGELRTSTDTVAWVTQTSNFGSDRINSVAYNNSLWVAGGYTGQLRTSTDAVTWVTQTSNFGNTRIRSIAYGNSLWVAASDNGQIRSSTDAITWTTRTSNFDTASSDGDIFAVAYGNNLWVAGGRAGNLRTSTDTVTWTTRTSNFGNHIIRGIAYGNNSWVAVGDGGGYGHIRNSTDGTTWTTAQPVSSANGMNYQTYHGSQAVAFSPSYFVAVAGNHYFWASEINEVIAIAASTIPLTLSVDISGSDVRLRATITDAGSTTAVVKVLKTLVE